MTLREVGTGVRHLALGLGSLPRKRRWIPAHGQGWRTLGEEHAGEKTGDRTSPSPQSEGEEGRWGARLKAALAQGAVVRREAAAPSSSCGVFGGAAPRGSGGGGGCGTETEGRMR
jgi:hypothetical protein